MPRSFSLHIGFRAFDETEALCQATTYADGLKVLRPEIDDHTVRVSPDHDWSRSTLAFCGAAGPGAGDICVEATGHAGWHFSEGKGSHWTDADVPHRPETIVDGDTRRSSERR